MKEAGSQCKKSPGTWKKEKLIEKRKNLLGKQQRNATQLREINKEISKAI